MKKETVKNLHIAVCFGLICAVLMRFAGFNDACDDLKSSVLRLHIIANSDSAEDQRLKIMVRDRILSDCSSIFEECTDLESAILAAESNLGMITATACDEILQNGAAYTATANVGTTYFETREYDDFTLPAGNYRSLIVNLGAGKGKNWWCVVFPTVCLPAASDASLSDSADDKSAYIAEHPERYEIRFKAVEWYEEIKKKLSRK